MIVYSQINFSNLVYQSHRVENKVSSTRHK